MAPHSSTLAWKIPWMEEPGRLQSMGSLGVRHDWATSLSLFTFMHWRRKWQPTPVFLPGESPVRGSLVSCGHRVGHDWSDLAVAYLNSLFFFFFPINFNLSFKDSNCPYISSSLASKFLIHNLKNLFVYFSLMNLLF